MSVPDDDSTPTVWFKRGAKQFIERMQMFLRDGSDSLKSGSNNNAEENRHTEVKASESEVNAADISEVSAAAAPLVLNKKASCRPDRANLAKPNLSTSHARIMRATKLTLTEAAQQLGIAVKTLRNWVGAELIEYIQYSEGSRILFRQEIIDAVIAGSTKPARVRKYVRSIHTTETPHAA